MNDELRPEPGYETRDVAIGRIMIFTVLGIVGIVAALVIVTQIFIQQTETEIYQSVLAPESSALRELRAREDEELNSYGIIDTTGTGVYRIPIERSMQLLADEAYRDRVGE